MAFAHLIEYMPIYKLTEVHLFPEAGESLTDMISLSRISKISFIASADETVYIVGPHFVPILRNIAYVLPTSIFVEELHSNILC